MGSRDTNREPSFLDCDDFNHEPPNHEADAGAGEVVVGEAQEEIEGTSIDDDALHACVTDADNDYCFSNPNKEISAGGCSSRDISTPVGEGKRVEVSQCDADYDPEVFNQLPDEIKKELSQKKVVIMGCIITNKRTQGIQ